MAQTIKIKRSTSAAQPSSALSVGELAYSFNSSKLFIGDGSNNDIIGGELFVNMLDHSAGTLTASSAIIVDSNSKIDRINVDNLRLDGNTLSSTSGNIAISSATGTISVAGAAHELLIADNSSTSLVIKEGTTSYLTFDTTNSSEKILFGRTLDINGNELILDADGDTSITADTDDIIDFRVAGSDELKLTSSSLRPGSDAGLTLGTSSFKYGSAFIDNIKLDGNSITSTDSNGNINITPDGSGKVILTGDGTTSNGGVSISNGLIDLKNSGTVSQIKFYCESANAHAQTLQGAAHSLSASNTLTLPHVGTVLATTDGAQTLTNKTLTSPDINGGTVDNAVIGGSTAAAGTFTTLTASSSITDGTATLSSGGLTSLTNLTVDNVQVNGNAVSTTNSNGNLELTPNGTGTVTVPSGYKDRSGFGATSLATKEYVDATKTGLDFKESVRVATTANITISTALNDGDTLDGITLANGDRILVKNQTTGSENGIYVVAASPARATDFDENAEVTSGAFVFVEEGTVNADQGFVLTTDGSITVGTTSLAFTQFSGAGQIVAGDAMSKSGNTLNVNDDNITLEVNSDALRIKGITQTAVGDLLIGAGTNTGYVRLAKPSSNDAFLTMGTAGSASWTTTIDGGTF
tara:strand:+ start:768 stop:2681 length:1914 start_codon:yes stop_codon:yes gene_type:complete